MPLKDGVEIDDHGLALEADLEEVVEVAVGVQQRLPQAVMLAPVQVERHRIADGVVGVDAHVEVVREVILGLLVLRGEVVLEELGQHLVQLARAVNGAEDVPGAEVIQLGGPIGEPVIHVTDGGRRRGRRGRGRRQGRQGGCGDGAAELAAVRDAAGEIPRAAVLDRQVVEGERKALCGCLRVGGERLVEARGW